MEKKLNQQGITLVELIAALALVSMVAVLIMTTLSIGIKQSIIENDKVQIQQQSNLIVSQLLNIHRKGEPYCMELFQDTTDNSDPFVNLRIMDYDCVINKITILPESMNYNIKGEMSIDLNSINAIDVTATSTKQLKVIPKSEIVELEITLDYIGEKKSQYKINTILSRYQTD